MERKLSWMTATVLGLFVVATLAMGAVGLILIGDREGWLAPTLRLETTLASVPGLRPGTKVRVLGIPVGAVSSVEAPSKPGEPVLVRFWVAADRRELLRADASTRLVKEGLVGERILEIDPGSPASPPIQAGARLASQSSADWDELLVRANRIFDDAQTAFLSDESRAAWEKTRHILREVSEGKGTVGKLLRDDELYRSAHNIGAKMETLLDVAGETNQAVRSTWLLRGLVKDPYELMVRPTVTKFAKVHATKDLFQEGTAVLTEAGQKQLVEIAAWIATFENHAEFLVAAFALDDADSRRAQVTTQAQADAVLRELQRLGALRLGWFGKRSMIAYGFANRANPNGEQDQRKQRIEIIGWQ